jgi:hypothetical protein
MPEDVEQIGERIISAYGRDGLRLLDRATLLQAVKVSLAAEDSGAKLWVTSFT